MSTHGTPSPMGSLYDFARTQTLEVAGEPLALTFAHLKGKPGNAGLQFVLLHGNPAHLGQWSQTVPALLEWGDVCAIDLPGFGRSQTPRDKVMSLDRLA